MKQIAPIAAALTLALAACSGEADAPSEGADVELTVSTTDEPFAADEAIDDPDILKGEIPARYLGVWDYVEGTCSRESDMLLEIAPRSITFYESFGLVTGVGQDGGDAIADLVMEGEGETWINILRLSLVEVDGETQLHTSDGTEAKVVDEYPRKKCS
jgi:hypothetical protein